MACMVDMNLEPLSTDASNYYQLARAALSLDSVLEHPTTEAVCAMVSFHRKILLVVTDLQSSI